MRRRQRRVVVWYSDNGPLTFQRLLDDVADVAIVARTRFVELRFPEVRGKIEKLRAQPDFCQQNRSRGSLKQGSGRPILVFPALPKAPAGSMRQILESPSTPFFSCKETAGRSVVAICCGRHVGILPHTSVLRTSLVGLLIGLNCGIRLKPCYLYQNCYT